MSAIQALKAARAVGIRLGIDGEDLVLQAPAEPPTTVLEALTRHKADILALLRPMNGGWTAEDWQAFYDERASILEYDSELPRPDAEAQAYETCIIDWLNCNPAPSPADRCAWCGGHETSSDGLVPFGTEPGTHAWLHPECWRPWHNARRAEALKGLSRIGIFLGTAPGERA